MEIPTNDPRPEKLHKRPPPGPPLTELIELRKKKFPGTFQRYFATELLGVSRLHMTAVEMGRRQPSIDLVLKWLVALAPEAQIEMFGPVAAVDTFRKVQEFNQRFNNSPKKAA